MFTLFSKILLVPKNGWQLALNQSDKRSALLKYAFPLIIATSLGSFLGVQLEAGDFELLRGLHNFTTTALTLFFSIYLCAFVMKLPLKAFCNRKMNVSELVAFSAYSHSMMFVVYFFCELFEGFVFVKICSLYTFYIVYEGAIEFLKLTDVTPRKRTWFVILSGLAVIFMWSVIETGLASLMPGLSS